MYKYIGRALPFKLTPSETPTVSGLACYFKAKYCGHRLENLSNEPSKLLDLIKPAKFTGNFLPNPIYLDKK